MITQENVSTLEPEQKFFIGKVEPDYDTETDTKRPRSNIDRELLALKRKNIQETIRLHSNTNPRLLADIGQINGDRGKTTAAKKAYVSAIAKNPKNINIRMKYIDTLIQLGRLDDALDQITYTEKIVSTDSRISLKRLRILFDLSYADNESRYTSDFKVAVKNYISKFENDYRAYNLLGLFNALILKDFNEAKQNLEKSFSIEENYVALTNLGNCYWELDNLKSAEAYFKKAIDFNKNEELAHINLINLYINEKNYSKALEHINESEKYVSNADSYYLYQKGWLLLKNDQPEAALEWNLNMTKAYPDNFKLYNNIGNCHKRLGNVEEAFKSYFKSIRLSKKLQLPPEDLKQYYNALLLAADQKDTARSMHIAKQLLEVDPNSLIALYSIANMKFRDKKFEAAKTEFKKIIKLDPSSHDAYVSLSFIYTEIDDNQEDAILLLETADPIVDKTNQGDGFYNNLAYALIKSNMLEDADEVLKKTSGSAYALSTNALLQLYKGHEDKYDVLFKQSLKKFKFDDTKLALQSYNFEKAYFKSNNNGNKDEILELLNKTIEIDKLSYFSDKASALMKKIQVKH